MWSAQAQAEGLTLLVAENTTGYFGVHHRSDRPKPYTAQVWRGGKDVSLGRFATAEEAALCVARSPEGRAAAAERVAAAPPLTSEEARQRAQAEGLTLRVAENKAGYFGVSLTNSGLPKPYKAQVRHGGKNVSLGYFATAEEAALCVARSPEGQAAAERAAADPALLTSEEARQQAQAEGLTLRVADNNAGYFGVNLANPGHPKPFQARLSRSGKNVRMGSFATAEEAALCIARLPEGQAAAQRAAAAPPLTGDDDGGDDTGEESEEETVEVLDAVEVLVASDDGGDEEALAIEAGEVTLVAERKRARESTRLGKEEPRARSTRLVGTGQRR
eukprot:scaffold28790_cov59-Phaeocystis_antarctica.AAC.2